MTTQSQDSTRQPSSACAALHCLTCSLLTIFFLCPTTQAETATWDFTNDAEQSSNGTTKTSLPTSNNFPAEITISPLTLNPNTGESSITSDHDTPSQHGYVSYRSQNPSASITLTIPAGTSVDLSNIAFTYGITDNRSITRTGIYTLTSSLGGITSNATNTITVTNGTPGTTSQNYTATFGQELQNLTNTTVTLTWTFNTAENFDSLNANRGHIIDNITLTGTTTETAPTPIISTFTASPTTVEPGETTTLSWQVQDADTISISPSIGDVTPITTNGTGSTTITVNERTTFTLTATNEGGNSSSTTLVKIPPQRPNVLVVLIDDMGTEDTSVDFNYRPDGTLLSAIDPTTVGLTAWTTPGNNHYRTPNMETLAANGMKFSRAYASQVCSPTRVSIMSGQNTARHGTHQYISGGGNLFNIKAPPNPGLKDFNRTLAEVLRDSGYRTIISGKGHIGSEFDSNANNYVTPAPPESDFYGFQVNVSASSNGQQKSCYSNASPAFKLNNSGTSAAFIAEYQDKTYHDIDPITYPTGSPLANEPVFVTEAITREMNDRIEDSVNDDLPFFAYMSHFAVHAPHDLDPRFEANYPGLSGQTLNFATMIEGMDQSLGDIVSKLDELGVAENTLIIFLGDNGSDSKPRGGAPNTLTMSNPLRGEKAMRYEGGVRVPLLIAWAKPDTSNPFQQALAIQGGSRVDDIVSAEDLYPTVLATAGVPLPTIDDAGNPLVIDGTDLSPYLRGIPGHHRRQVHLNNAPNSQRNSFFVSLHQDWWKLIYNYASSQDNANDDVPLGSWQLYNLADDPYEANDLAKSASAGYNPVQLMNMARLMVSEMDRMGGPLPILKASDPSLASLGLPSAEGDTHPIILPAIPGVDSDNDGLDDNTEDPNRNGIAESNETLADNEDTDGDNTNDGNEIRLGTNPLNAGESFTLKGLTQSNGNITLSWPSLPGTRFIIHAGTDLLTYPDTINNDLPADAGNSTSITIPATSSVRFFKVELKN